ncbi:hypothetical protein QBC44DRAFT_357529 [Cladorrhinum sp. PSN332]|nr:hypothetical protein QBC44DRAFT_357529 [Cladorrhinum sp. PSN332]
MPPAPTPTRPSHHLPGGMMQQQRTPNHQSPPAQVHVQAAQTASSRRPQPPSSVRVLFQLFPKNKPAFEVVEFQKKCESRCPGHTPQGSPSHFPITRAGGVEFLTCNLSRPPAIKGKLLSFGRHPNNDIRLPSQSLAAQNTQSEAPVSQRKGGPSYQSYRNEHFFFFLSASGELVIRDMSDGRLSVVVKEAEAQDPKIYDLDWVKVSAENGTNKVRQRVIPRTKAPILIYFGLETEFLLKWVNDLGGSGTSDSTTQSELAHQALELALKGLTITGFRGSDIKPLHEEPPQRPTLRSDFAPSTTKIRTHRPIHRYGQLGAGSSSTVFKVVDLSSGELFAVKEFQSTGKAKKDKELQNRMTKEVDMLTQLRHKNIVQLLHYQNFNAGGKFQLFFPLHEGSLATLVQTQSHTCGQPPQTPPTWWSALVTQLTTAVEFIHAAGVIHRDIKPSNILFTHGSASGKEYSFVLGDFGLAIKEATIKESERLYDCTAFYAAPEVTIHGKPCLASDIYSVAMTLGRVRGFWCEKEMGWTSSDWAERVLGGAQQLSRQPEHLAREESEDWISRVSELVDRRKLPSQLLKMLSRVPKERSTARECKNARLEAFTRVGPSRTAAGMGQEISGQRSTAPSSAGPEGSRRNVPRRQDQSTTTPPLSQRPVRPTRPTVTTTGISTPGRPGPRAGSTESSPGPREADSSGPQSAITGTRNYPSRATHESPSASLPSISSSPSTTSTSSSPRARATSTQRTQRMAVDHRRPSAPQPGLTLASQRQNSIQHTQPASKKQRRQTTQQTSEGVSAGNQIQASAGQSSQPSASNWNKGKAPPVRGGSQLPTPAQHRAQVPVTGIYQAAAQQQGQVSLEFAGGNAGTVTGHDPDPSFMNNQSQQPTAWDQFPAAGLSLNDTGYQLQDTFGSGLSYQPQPNSAFFAGLHDDAGYQLQPGQFPQAAMGWQSQTQMMPSQPSQFIDPQVFLQSSMQPFASNQPQEAAMASQPSQFTNPQIFDQSSMQPFAPIQHQQPTMPPQFNQESHAPDRRTRGHNDANGLGGPAKSAPNSEATNEMMRTGAAPSVNLNMSGPWLCNKFDAYKGKNCDNKEFSHIGELLLHQQTLHAPGRQAAQCNVCKRKLLYRDKNFRDHYERQSQDHPPFTSLELNATKIAP